MRLPTVAFWVVPTLSVAPMAPGAKTADSAATSSTARSGRRWETAGVGRIGHGSFERDGRSSSPDAGPARTFPIVAPNVFDPQFEPGERPDGFGCRRARAGDAVGRGLVGAGVFELPPGEAA